MDRREWAELADAMAAMAAGDSDGAWRLCERFGAPIGAHLRRILRTMGVARVTFEELDGMIVDVCLDLFECAHAWDPGGGAPPWRWAHHRLVAICRRHVGQHAARLDDVPERAGDTTALAAVDAAPLATLAKMAATDPRVARVSRALRTVGSERDVAVLLELRMQADAGDPSPAVTVGALYGMRPDAVRQAASRMRRRLRALATRPEFAGLHELALVS